MSVYAKENPSYLDQALESNLLNQTVRPSELVLVKDGPLTPELDAVVDRWVQRAENLDCPPIQVVDLAQNVGLAEALNAVCRRVCMSWLLVLILMICLSDSFCASDSCPGAGRLHGAGLCHA